MAIRLRLKLVKENNSVEVTALVNSGYETLEPEILVPSSVARKPIPVSPTPTGSNGERV